MKKKLTLSLILSILTMPYLQANELTIFNDIADYKETKQIDLSKVNYISLTDTAILDSLNVNVKHENKNIPLKSLKLYKKNEENIFKVNINEEIYINEKKYILLENGNGYIKVKNKDNLTTYIPKNKIDFISFSKNIKTNNHIAEIITNKSEGLADLSYSYSLGEIKWKPKYNIYIKDKNLIELEYNIEIENNSKMTLKNTKVEFILDENNRIYNEYEKEENLGIFSYNVHKVNENKDVNYNKLIYDKNGFNQSGFDKSGFDKSGLSEKLNSYNVYESKSSKKVLSIENGRRVLKFDQPLNIYQNSKSIYPFYSSENIKYKKENRIFISSFSKKEDVYIPESTLIIENEKGLYFSKGVARIFSGSKQNNPNVINELNINSSKKDYKRDIIINIGENAGLKSKIKDTIKEELASIEIKSSFYPFFKEKEDFKVTLTKKSISFFNYTNEKNIKIVNSRLIHKKDIENVKKIINNFDSKEHKEELNKLSHKLNELTVEDILLDINNKKEINEDFYFLEYYTKTN